MANVTTEGTKVYVATAGTSVATYTAIETAITAGDQVGCIQELGAINSSRPVNKSKCISTGEISVSVGGKEMDDFTISLKFNALDTAGMAALKDVYNTNTAVVMIYSFNDKPTGTLTHPTYLTLDAKVSKVSYDFQKDNDIFYNITVTPLSNTVEVPAAVVTP